MDKELIEKIKYLTRKEISLTELAKLTNTNKLKILGLIVKLEENEGINISRKLKDDDIYLFNHGEKEYVMDNSYNFETNSDNEIKFTIISDTRFGSKSQQLSILNDIYEKTYDFGIDKVLLCGNITEGLYKVDSPYAHTLFLDDSLRQAEYVADNFPKIDGIKTYFITGPKDSTHLKTNKINIGKRISEMREDMHYLGEDTCFITIDKLKMLLLNLKLAKTYTVSYRAQQLINSIRSEDKPDILIYGGLLQKENFTYRNVKCISVPSVSATTLEMTQKRYANTIGTWYSTIKTDKRGNLDSFIATSSPYYITYKDDYIKAKRLVIKKGDNTNDR